MDAAIFLMRLLYLRPPSFLVLSVSHQSCGPLGGHLTLRFPRFCGKPCGKERLGVSTSLCFSNLHCLHILCCNNKSHGINHLRGKHWTTSNSITFVYKR